MSVVNGTDYEHVDVSKNGTTVRHMYKDANAVHYGASDGATAAQKAQARSNIGAASTEQVDDVILVQDATPSSEDNKIWIPETTSEGVEVPTYAEFEELLCPTNTDGTFILKCTVTNGVPMYSWVNE